MAEVDAEGERKRRVRQVVATLDLRFHEVNTVWNKRTPSHPVGGLDYRR
jgi:hypothetical protein